MGTRKDLVSILNTIFMENAVEGDIMFTENDEFNYYYNHGGLSTLEDKLHALFGTFMNDVITVLFEKDDKGDLDADELRQYRR